MCTFLVPFLPSVTFSPFLKMDYQHGETALMSKNRMFCLHAMVTSHTTSAERHVGHSSFVREIWRIILFINV